MSGRNAGYEYVNENHALENHIGSVLDFPTLGFTRHGISLAAFRIPGPWHPSTRDSGNGLHINKLYASNSENGPSFS